MRVERIVPWRRTIAAGDARNRWRERRGWLIVVEHDGVRGIGEASPLPGFGGDPALAMRFALETAVLDALARARGVTLAEVLVAAPAARVPVNALVHDAASAQAAVARGFATVKVKLGPDGAPDRVTDLVRAITAAAPGVRVRGDANQSWPLGEVARWLGPLAGMVEYVEEPAAGLAARLRAPLPVPVALDESLALPDRDAWLDGALGSGAVAAVVLKPTVLGGFAACAALAARARRHGVDVVVTHALEGPVGFAACCELARALGCTRAAGLDRHVTLDAWDHHPAQLAGATLGAPAGPGLGLDIDTILASAGA